MIKEKHILTNPYNHHALSRYVDVYEVSTNRCHSVPESGYKGTECTLVDNPAWNEKFSSYSITGATLTGNNFVLNNDVTAQAIYETAKNVTTINCDSTKNSGFIGDTASLSVNLAWDEKLNSYDVTGTVLTGSDFRFTGSDITALANIETAKNVTIQPTIHGTISSDKMSGFSGDVATITTVPDAGYSLDTLDITGSTLTANNFMFLNSNINIAGSFINKYNPLDLPDYTIRLKYKDGVTPSPRYGTVVQVSSSPNVWDLTYNNSDWSLLLYGNSDLLEVLGANTTGVTNMSSMFRGCTSLTTVPLFDTAKVTHMNNMFDGCTSLTTVALFNTSNVKNMSYMFQSCTSLTTVPLFNTSNVRNIMCMFYNCYNVQSGSLALYQQASTQTNPPTYHDDTFKNCGSNTQTGAAELAQIPSDWGGTGA